MKNAPPVHRDEYFTIAAAVESEIKIKGSRFIGNASPATSKEAAEEFIRQTVKKYHNATHNCHAYQIGLDDSLVYRYSDAGEPAGTAGAPILQTIRAKGLTDVVVVVSRYFGGTKLGTGGLIRAYSECTSNVLDKSTVVKKFICSVLSIEFSYPLTGSIMHLISAIDVKVLASEYGGQVRLKLEIRKSRVEDFRHRAIEATAGQIKFW